MEPESEPESLPDSQPYLYFLKKKKKQYLGLYLTQNLSR